MSKIGDGLGWAARPDLGVGFPMRPEDIPGVEVVEYNSFAGGLVAPANRSLARMDQSIDAEDMEPNVIGQLVVSPGVSGGNIGSQSNILKYLFVQTGLDFINELVCIDSPDIGVATTGAMVFAGAALAAKGAFDWNATNYLDTLVFSNGSTATYTRLAIIGTITDISAAIVARTFAAAFGRLFAAGYTDGSGYQALGIKWNGTSAAVDDFSGDGSGAELLIAETRLSDRIVALRAIGQDFLGILCRHSLWVGVKTNEENRPADFRIRFPGIGCVAEPTACVTPGGVTFLSEQGVVNFNASQFEVISTDINSILLPLDYTQLTKYRADYDPVRQRYVLLTPTYTYVYEFPKPGSPARWSKRSIRSDGFGSPTLTAVGLVVFASQAASADEQSSLYYAVLDSQSGNYFLQPEDPTKIKLFANDFPDAYWITPADPRFSYNRYIQTIGFYISYRTSGSSITFLAVNPAINAGFNPGGAGQITLENTAGVMVERYFPCSFIGISSSLKFLVARGSAQINLRIGRVRQLVIDAGERPMDSTT